MQNGDLNWVLPGKLLAFAGPTAIPKTDFGFRTFTPEDYWGYFRGTGVAAVVRLNNKVRSRCARFAHFGLQSGVQNAWQAAFSRL